jgi:hypothetical protein
MDIQGLLEPMARAGWVAKPASQYAREIARWHD